MAKYASIYQGPARNYGASAGSKRYVAIHDTSNDASAKDEMSYAKRRTDSVSSHYYADGNSVIQALDTDLVAWHAGSSTGNARAIAYEITGVNGWTRAQWLARVAWPLLARQIAKDCREHDIEPRILTVAQMQDGRSTGLVTHDLMRRAWGGTDHTDPGPNFPMDHLLDLVRAELNGATMADVALTPLQNKFLTASKTRLEALATGARTSNIDWDDVEGNVEKNWAVGQLAKIDGLAKEGSVTLSAEQLDDLADRIAAKLAPPSGAAGGTFAGTFVYTAPSEVPTP